MERFEAGTGNGVAIPSDTLARQKQLAALQAQAESAAIEPVVAVETEEDK